MKILLRFYEPKQSKSELFSHVLFVYQYLKIQRKHSFQQILDKLFFFENGKVHSIENVLVLVLCLSLARS